MSFLEELAKLNQPAPSLPDLEDIGENDINKTRFDEGIEVPQRRKILVPSFQDDPKYIGKKVNRSEIFDDDEDSEEEEDEEEQEDEVSEESLDEEDIEEQNAIPQKNGIKNGHIDSDEEEEETDEEEMEDEDDMEDEEEANKIESKSEENEDLERATSNMKNIMVSLNQEKESKKAQSVRVQQKQWEQLLYLKIKLQTAIRAYNQLPRGHLAKELMKNCDEETRKNIELARKNAKEMVRMLLDAEHTLLSSSPLTQSIVGVEGGMADSDDEEIESSEDEAEDNNKDKELSDEDEEEMSDEDEPTAKIEQKTGTSWKALENRLKQNEEKFDKFRAGTLSKWYERTKLSGPRNSKEAKNDFSDFEQGNITQQIDKVMKDKARILKRCHTKRTDIERIGGDPEAEIDEEIYEDDDFYQVLLKELIDKKTGGATDSVSMTRHFIEMQKLARRTKKKVYDQNSTKDRKIKYVPIPKLINFHPARPELVTWTHESRNELFKSLFK